VLYTKCGYNKMLLRCLTTQSLGRVTETWQGCAMGEQNSEQHFEHVNTV
jgi:hypothetical protein